MEHGTKQYVLVKRYLVFALVFLLGVFTVYSTITFPFQGWDWLKNTSPDIVVVRSVEIPAEVFIGPMTSKIQIASVLKGTNHVGPSKLDSFFTWPRPGEYYLVFGRSQADHVQAFEEYRIVPLGPSVSPETFPGKSMDEKIQKMLKYRLDCLESEMKKDAEEKRRLKEAFH